MKIGIDCRTILDPQNEHGGGIERYTFTLATELMKVPDVDFVYFLPEGYQSDVIFKDQPHVTLEYVPSGGVPLINTHARFLSKIHAHKLDIFFSPITSLPLGLRVKSIVTVHDLAIYLHPEWFPDGQWLSKKVLVPKSLQKAKKIISVSNKTKEDCVSLFDIDPAKIEVVYNTLPDQKYFFKIPGEAVWVPKRFILSIGTLEPRKNLERVFTVFHALKRDSQYKDLALVVIGNEGWKTDAVFGTYTRKELEKLGVIFLQNVTEKEKWKILTKAEVLFFPSLYEGFGLPVLEALSIGKKVVTSKEGALPEVGRDDVVYVDPYDINEMIEKLKTELASDRFVMPDLKPFSAEVFVKKLVSVFEEVY